MAAVGLSCGAELWGQPVGSPHFHGSSAAALCWFLPGPSGWCYLLGPGPGLQSLLS